jgi:hypothetical protein
LNAINPTAKDAVVAPLAEYLIHRQGARRRRGPPLSLGIGPDKPVYQFVERDAAFLGEPSSEDETGTSLPCRQVRWDIGKDRIDASELLTANYAQVRFYRQAIIERAKGQTKAQVEDASTDL